MIFPPKKCTFTPIYRKISAGGRQTVSGSSSSKVILTILSRLISFISPWFWEKLTIKCLFKNFSPKKYTFTPIYRKISAGGRQTVFGSSSSKVIQTILSKPISFISPWFRGKLTIMCLFMIFPPKKCTFTPIYRKISAGGRQTVCGSSSSKVILTILSRPISFISPWFWE